MGASGRRQRPSRIWIASAVPTMVLAVVFIAGAIAFQRDATRPVGEGELFRLEAEQVAGIVSGGAPVAPDRAVRHARNALTVEAVSLLDADGRVTASTSDALIGEEGAPGMLGFALQQGRFAALATPITTPISIDGVVEWPAGATLYSVLQPFPDGGAVLLHYDLAELLERRVRDAGIQALTLQLVGGGALLLAIGLALLGARRVAARRILQTRREAEELQRHSRQLEQHNFELDAARRAAERALELAEETNRIRSEFVLMINHELRTPLTSVVTGAEVLRSGMVDGEEADRVLDAMVRDGRRLHELIAQILHVARIENRGLSYTLADIPVAAVLERVAARSPADVEVPQRGVGAVRCDRDGLTQLLSSLCDNALAHGAQHVAISTVPELPFTPHLVVGRPGESQQHFLVADDGPGIPSDFLPRAFEKFEKQSFDSGTGLGLYLARLMIEAMDGSIAVHTGPTGTTMAVGVPVAEVAAEMVA